MGADRLKADPGEIRRALELLCEPGAVYELRALGTPKGTVSGYFDKFEKLVENAVVCSDRLLAHGVYLTLNPVKRDLIARASNRLESYAKHTTGDIDIVKRLWLPLDFDPVRPAGISSTGEEHIAALERAMTARETLAGLGWPTPISADSGNGAHVPYRIDLPNDDASRELLKRVLDSLDSLFSDEVVAVDKANFNAARIWKLYGTPARKGDSTPDRPHRLARILDAPEARQIVSPEQLEEIARMLPRPEPPARSNSTAQSSFNLENWIAGQSIDVARESAWSGGRRWILRHCLFDPSHGGSGAAILQLSSGAIAYRCLHNSCAHRTWRDVRDLLEPGWHDRRKAVAEGDRPEIYVDQNQLRDKVAQALAALGKANDPPLLFCRGGMLTRLHDTSDSVELEGLDDAALLSELSEAANWYRHSRNDEAVDADPPANVARALRGSRRFPFPHIDAVVRAPFFTPDGSLITTSGYHADARVYVALDSALTTQLDAQLLPEWPTPEDIAWARALLLDELFCDFPLVGEASKAHAVALTLLPFVRKMIDGPTPNHAVTAPAQGEGTGKGLLVQAACAPGLGEIATIPETRDNDELKKFLLAILIEGAPVALLDNRKHEIDSGVLAAVLTARHWQDRILGKSKTARPTVLTTWVITGNALRFSGEMARRTVRIRLNANTPQPWKRTGFKHELPGWAYEHRADLIRACIILVRNWLALGRAAGTRTLGSYEAWARVMGGIIAAAGIPGFLVETGEPSDDCADNQDANRWNPFIEGWWEKYSEQSVFPKDLLDLAMELVPETEKSTDRSRSTRLGNLLSKNVGQVFAAASVDESYLKIVRENVERKVGGRHRGYALKVLAKNSNEVGKVGGTVEPAEKPAENEKNSSANLLDPGPAPRNEVGGPQVPDFRPESGNSPTPPTSAPDSTGERRCNPRLAEAVARVEGAFPGARRVEVRKLR